MHGWMNGSVEKHQFVSSPTCIQQDPLRFLSFLLKRLGQYANTGPHTFCMAIITQRLRKGSLRDEGPGEVGAVINLNVCICPNELKETGRNYILFLKLLEIFYFFLI